MMGDSLHRWVCLGGMVLREGESGKPGVALKAPRGLEAMARPAAAVALQAPPRRDTPN
jgi:hypothetical protein